MKTISYQGVEYQCPFSELFRRHTKDERLTLLASVRTNGIKQSVLLYEDTIHGENCILDGEGRMTVAAAIPGIRIPFKLLGSMTTEEAFEQAKIYNDHRRQDDAESISKRKAERIERVAESVKKGESIRNIADNEGISKAQAERDKKEALKTGAKPPKEVTGRDGKKYSKRKSEPVKPQDVTQVSPTGHLNDSKRADFGAEEHPKTGAKKQAESSSVLIPDSSGDISEGLEEKSEPEAKKPAIVQLDGWDIPIQPHATAAFALVGQFNDLVKCLKAVQKSLSDLAESPAGPFLKKRLQWSRKATKDDPQAGRWIFKGLDDTVLLIQDCTPTYTVCPYMHNDEKPHPDPCNTCLMNNWTAQLWKASIPESLIAKAKEVYCV